MVLTTKISTKREEWKRPIPLRNPGTPRLPRIGLMDNPYVCAMQTIGADPKRTPCLKKSESKDSGIGSISSAMSRGKAVFESATMLLACYISVSLSCGKCLRLR